MNFYDLIYITDIPAFYKINLFNRIAKSRKIFVIFLKDHHSDRNADFYTGGRNFDWILLNRKLLINKIIILIRLLRSSDYRSLIIGGWDNVLYWISAFISPRSKNAVVVESSIIESKTNGLLGILKRVFLSRISKSYTPGKAHKKLMQKLHFKGTIIITKGVGISNFSKQPAYNAKEQVKNFIFVGRLSREKNLEYLVNTFNKFPDYILNIIGYGPLESKLKKIALKNIKFHGAIENSLLTNYYLENDALILPSLSETWGLVVEEALNNGLPVIISENVGCLYDIIIPDYNCRVFSLSESNSLQKAILRMTDINYYNNLRRNISKMDFEEAAELQVRSYL